MYTRVNWEDLPSTYTPINATNLNKMDKGIYDNEQAIATKATLSDIEDNLINVSNEVDEDYRVNLIKSKNLYDKNTDKLSAVLQSNGTINTGSTYSSYRTSDYILVKPNTQYTISRVYDSSTGAEDLMRVGYYTNDKTFIERPYSSDKPYTITTPNNCYYVRLSYEYTKSNTNVQLEEGNTATTYSSFIPNQIVVDNEKYSDTLNVGASLDSRSRVNVLYSKNLFDKDNANTLNGYFFATSPTTITSDAGNRVLYIPCKPNTTYTIQKTPQTNTRQLGYTKTTPAIGTQVYGIVEFTGTTGTITTGADAQYLVCRYYQSAQDTAYTETQIKASIIIQEGSSIITPSIYVDNEEIYSKPVVLWQNSSPTSAFSNQSVSLSDDLTNYKYYEVIYIDTKSSSIYFSTGRLPYNVITYLTIAIQTIRRRYIEPRGTTMTFASAEVFSTYGGSATTNNDNLIPYQILGYK